MDFNALRLHMQDASAWYDLAPLEKGIAVSLHPAEYKVAMDIMTRRALLPDYGKELDGGHFFLPSPKIFGFGRSCAVAKPDDRGWPTIECRFPRPKRKYDFDLERLYKISGTLQTLFSSLNHGGRVTNEARRQYFSVELHTRREVYGGALFAKLSPSLLAWLRSVDQPVIDEINAHMARLGRILFGASFAREREYNVYLRSDGVPIFNCPGDACDLSPTGENYNLGCELSPHNTDSPLQQLALLSGLAGLNQVARRAGV